VWQLINIAYVLCWNLISAMLAMLAIRRRSRIYSCCNNIYIIYKRHCATAYLIYIIIYRYEKLTPNWAVMHRNRVPVFNLKTDSLKIKFSFDKSLHGMSLDCILETREHITLWIFRLSSVLQTFDLRLVNTSYGIIIDIKIIRLVRNIHKIIILQECIHILASDNIKSI